jgi:ATP-dependent RNA helicase DeaD
MSDVLNGLQEGSSVVASNEDTASVAVSGFDVFPVQPEIKTAIAALGYTQPTEVQARVVASAVSGRDMVVQSKTGSGKTSAFGIPVIERVFERGAKPHAPHALVLVPTRELAFQVAQELRALGKSKGVQVFAVYGGVPMGKQMGTLRMAPDVVVGTPGRLLDHVRKGTLVLSSLKVLVLDEADEMLSMGFWEDVTELLSQTPDTRQTMLFSATLPYDVAKAAAQFLKNPERVDVSGDALTVEGITNHIVHVSSDAPKPRQLLYVLEVVKPESAIIFCNTRHETEMIAKYLTQAGFVAEALTGGFKQADRERVMARIKDGQLKFMVATDIAARGIDIHDLSHVVNYSLPEFSEVYLHRVGRTGRGGKIGAAISLLDGRGLGTMTQLERDFGVTFTEMVLPQEEEVSRLRSARIMKELSEKASVAEVTQHVPVAQEILQNQDAAQVVAFLLKAYFATQAEGKRREYAAPRPHDNNRHGFEHGDASQARGRRRQPRRDRMGGSDYRHPRDNSMGGADVIDAHDVLSSEPVASAEVSSASAPQAVSDGLTRIRVNIGFDDGFKGRGSVAKKIAALAGLNEGIISEVDARRDHAVLKASRDIAGLVLDRVDGAQVGKKVITVVLED